MLKNDGLAIHRTTAKSLGEILASLPLCLTTKFTNRILTWYRVLVGKPEGKRPLGRPRLRWEDNVRMDLQEVGCGFEDWIGLAQDRDRWRALVSAVRNLRVP
jgi:hypothetical protein